MFLLIPDGNDSEFTLSVFTFHDVSINTTHHLILPLADRYFTFHDVSINTVVPLESVNRQTSLHSTMFLLIPIASGHRRKRSHFTFHDVSINTPSLTTLLTASLTLHSTMFLLILCLEVITQNHLITLHSTMFLLIHLVKHPS